MKLLIGGSPCTHWSIAQTKNRETEPSGLGWELFKNYLIAREKSYALLSVAHSATAEDAIARRQRNAAAEPVEYSPLHSCDVVVTDQNIHCSYKDGSGTAQGYTVTFDDVKSQTVTAGHAHKMKVITEVKPLTEREMEYMVRETKDGRNHFDFDYHHDTTKDKSSCITANVHRGVPYNVCCECVSPNPTEPAGINRLGGLYGQHTRWGIYDPDGKVPCITASAGMGGGHLPMWPERIGTIENQAKNPEHDSQQYRVYSPDAKSVTLCGAGGGYWSQDRIVRCPLAGGVPVNTTVDGKAQCLRATYYKDGIRNMVGNTIDRKTCVAVRIGPGYAGAGGDQAGVCRCPARGVRGPVHAEQQNKEGQSDEE